MYENNLLIKYGIIYDNKYICSKRCICTNAMWLLYVLVFTHRGIIDICINAPGRVICKIYGIKVSEKTCLKQKMIMIGDGESINESMIMNAALTICDKSK